MTQQELRATSESLVSLCREGINKPGVSPEDARLAIATLAKLLAAEALGELFMDIERIAADANERSVL